MSAGPFAALPPRGECANLALLTLAFAAWFGVFYGGASALAQFVPWRASVEQPHDVALPYWPGAAALYLTILPVMLLAPFVLRDLPSLLPLFAAFILETTVATFCFLLVPIDDPPVTCGADTLACSIFNLADTINLHLNNLPSLHVAFAFTTAWALARRASRAGAWLLYAWALAVTLSTLVTRQHFFVDVVAGLLLAAVCWRVAGSWAGQPGVVAAFDAELLALRHIALTVPRHRRYLFIAIAIYAASLPRWRRHRLLRTGYAFLQSLDDILDGDRPSDREPLDVAEELRESLHSGEFAAHDLARLGRAFRAELLAGDPGALMDALSLVDAMRNDRRRVLEREVSSRGELRGIHRRTFTPSVDLMMRAADSPLRAADVPELIDALGWCSSVRDLREDLAQGLVNIPAEAFGAARAERPDAAPADLLETVAVQEWLREERVQAAALVDRVDARLESLGSQRGAAVLRRFARSMRRYTRSP